MSLYTNIMVDWYERLVIDGLVQDCGNCISNGVIAVLH